MYSKLIAVAAFYAIIEAVWLTSMKGVYGKWFARGPLKGHGPLKIESVLSAGLTYALIALTFYFLVLRPVHASKKITTTGAATMGAAYGLATYGVYNLTNKSTIPGYGWNMVVVDTLWGTFSLGLVSTLFSILVSA
jgi:uncharacterized membrane protein